MRLGPAMGSPSRVIAPLPWTRRHVLEAVESLDRLSPASAYPLVTYHMDMSNRSVMFIELPDHPSCLRGELRHDGHRRPSGDQVLHSLVTVVHWSAVASRLPVDDII